MREYIELFVSVYIIINLYHTVSDNHEGTIPPHMQTPETPAYNSLGPNFGTTPLNEGPYQPTGKHYSD